MSPAIPIRHLVYNSLEIQREASLVKALCRGQSRGAGLDVFQREILPEGHPYGDLSNAVMTSHPGGVTAEALEAGVQMAIDNVLTALAGKAKHCVA